MDKQSGIVVAIVAVVLGLILGAMGFLRYDLGYDTFYFMLAFVFGVITTLIMAVIFSVGFRLAQRSDNVEVAMSGMMRALMDYQQHNERQQAQTFRNLMAEMPKPALTANPWGDDGDAYSFNIPPTVEHTNGTGAGVNGASRNGHH